VIKRAVDTITYACRLLAILMVVFILGAACYKIMKPSIFIFKTVEVCNGTIV
jgi:hypothetical protein